MHQARHPLRVSDEVRRRADRPSLTRSSSGRQRLLARRLSSPSPLPPLPLSPREGHFVVLTASCSARNTSTSRTSAFVILAPPDRTTASATTRSYLPPADGVLL